MIRFQRIALSLGLLLTAGSAFAQVAGSISGRVVDPSDAVVPGAAVKIYLQGGKDPVLTGVTNEDGLFTFIAVRPDTYDIAVDAKGFMTVTLRGQTVSPLQAVELPPIKLEVQATAQTVDVTASISTVNASNAEVSTTITNQMIQNLPVLDRQVTNFFQTQPGVVTSTDVTTVNGLRSSFTNVTLDGINVQDNFVRVNDLDYPPFRTTIDQVAEITVSTSNGTAAIGGGASQFIMSTKSGSNTYHGAVYWYNRNNALAANDWFNNRAGIKVPKLDLNQPGAALGGHLIKDKLFFYANVEIFRNKVQSSLNRTVLTDSAKQGIFTYLDTNNVTRTANLQTLRGYTPDPTVKAMLAQLPEPNAPGGDGLNTSGYVFNSAGNENRDQFVYKGDYYITPKHSISGTYDYINDPTLRPTGVSTSFYTVTPPTSNTIRNHLLSLDFRSTLSATFTNELRGGFARTHGNFDDSNAYSKFLLGGLLFNSPVNTFLAQGRDTNTYQIQDNANWIKGKHQVAFGFQYQLTNTIPFNDQGIVPTYTLGISSANTTSLTSVDLPGIRQTDLSRANNLYADLAGIISSDSQTFNVTSATSGFVPGATNLRHLSYSNYAAYIQDNWRLRPNLTLNLGLRYEYWTPVNEKDGLYLAPVLENNNLKQTLLDPNAPLNFIGGPSGRPFYNANKADFAPNVGFVWDPFKTGKTSIRGGYSMSYVNDNLIDTINNNVATNQGLSLASTQQNLTSFLTAAPIVPSPTFKVPRTPADNYLLTTTGAEGMPAPNLVTPRVHQWNLSIQREVHGLILTGRYVGNKGQDLLRALDYNQVLYNASGFLADFQRAQSNGDLAVAAGKAYNPSYNSSIVGSQPLPVFGQLVGGGLLTNSTIQTYIRNGSIGTLAELYQISQLNGTVNFFTNPYIEGANATTNQGMSVYHSLQLEATKRTRAGLQVQFSYIFGKSLSNTSGDSQYDFEPLLDNNNPGLEYTRTPYDIRHTFKANYYYELPFGPGKKWSSHNFADKMIGGWSLSGIWTYYSGSPYSVLSSLGTLNRVGRSTLTNTASIAGTTWSQLQPLTSGVFKTGSNVYFISPTLLAPGGYGTSQPGIAPFSGQIFYNPVAGNVGNLERRAFSGPWQWSWDASVKKTVKFTERHTLDLLFDFYNFMNHPTFYIPQSSAGASSAFNYGINSTTFGQITSMNYNPRQIQIGAYYRF